MITDDDLRAAGLTQAAAAELLAVAPNTIWRQVSGRLPTSGAVELLVAVWPLLSPDQRDHVRAAVARMRQRGR